MAAVLAVCAALVFPLPAEGATVVVNDVAYGAHLSQKLDVHDPGGAGTRAALIVVHGGGWKNGDKSEFTQLADYYATRVPAVAFNVNYRQQAEGRWPNAADDVDAALAWVVAHAADYRIDPARVGVLGASAGGHLGGLLLDRGVAAFVGWSGIYDFPLSDTDPLKNGNQQGIVDFMGCTYAVCPGAWTDASPVNHVTGVAALQLVSSTGEFVPPSQRQSLVAAQQAAGGYVEEYELPGTVHARALNREILPDGRTVKKAALDFFKAQLSS